MAKKTKKSIKDMAYAKGGPVKMPKGKKGC
jgi:hypothetical protein